MVSPTSGGTLAKVGPTRTGSPTTRAGNRKRVEWSILYVRVLDAVWVMGARVAQVEVYGMSASREIWGWRAGENKYRVQEEGVSLLPLVPL